ncbi:hypothetical protein [Enhygromyxa salina]|uniref:Uncharacterized protein n=1 Tax=Enhygromyxa salina TaxID=215803 RepID=A0A2S9XN78_9BACT|nr:hypothetical protein [Enhygromyxa salina]PRP94327.1 hypothetical protein ENSA7_78640 [Enhygromyxa salina]
MSDRLPLFPIHVHFSDGNHWTLDTELELTQNLEWFDSDDPEEEAEVTDALGRRVSVKIECFRMLRLELVSFPIRGPLIFVGSSGASDVRAFRDAAHAISRVETIDVSNGGYGDHGWDADGRLIKFVLREPGPPGVLQRLFRVVPAATVELRMLDTSPEPEALRRVLIACLVEQTVAQAAALEAMSLGELLGSVPISA